MLVSSFNRNIIDGLIVLMYVIHYIKFTLMVSWILMVTSKLILDADWLLCLVAMVVTIESKVSFMQRGPGAKQLLPQL